MNIDNKLGSLFEEIDNLMWAGKWDVIDEICKNTDVEKENLTMLLGLLTITLPGRVEGRLVHRADLFARIKSRIHLERPLDEYGLLVGLD